MKVLVANTKKCIGCRICEQWCSISHFGVLNPKKSRIRVSRNHDDFINELFVCRQCEDKPCIDECPDKIKALSMDEEFRRINVNEEECIACKKCAKVCPYGAINVHPTEKYVIICTLCNGDPQCVKHCPEQALEYIERKELEELNQTQEGGYANV
ncbi:4Fe-4S dicluster domain-containing protein [Desulfitibacter alkalitolerans]|uniref:4Fe-4S dicluster domain-containing protein n=1 Tax=Desulfitibacter alkalitolerans TaxID=264641 RepID=UPI0006849756|nr:4Fe-4S dicluster domain-containing protein [Desulfitibacter alkalitolerans]